MPFTPIFPYDFGGAGDINSTSRIWRAGSACSSATAPSRDAASSRPRISPILTRQRWRLNDQLFYALGWVIQQTPNGNIIWHDGDALSFGSFVGIVPDKNIGIIVLTNEDKCGVSGCARAMDFGPDS